MRHKRGSGKTEIELAEKEKVKIRIAELYLTGQSTYKIAGELSISQKTVHVYLTEIKKDWKERYITDFNEAQSRELARLDKLESEYWLAWERSKKPKVKEKRELEVVPGKTKANDKDKENEKESEKEITVALERETEYTAGDDKWLEGIRKIVEQRCKLLGLIAPNPTINNNTLIQQNNVQQTKTKVVIYLPEKEQDPRQLPEPTQVIEQVNQ